jgi:hypothetical protein
MATQAEREEREARRRAEKIVARGLTEQMDKMDKALVAEREANEGKK